MKHGIKSTFTLLIISSFVLEHKYTPSSATGQNEKVIWNFATKGIYKERVWLREGWTQGLPALNFICNRTSLRKGELEASILSEWTEVNMHYGPSGLICCIQSILTTRLEGHTVPNVRKSSKCMFSSLTILFFRAVSTEAYKIWHCFWWDVKPFCLTFWNYVLRVNADRHSYCWF